MSKEFDLHIIYYQTLPTAIARFKDELNINPTKAGEIFLNDIQQMCNITSTTHVNTDVFEIAQYLVDRQEADAETLEALSVPLFLEMLSHDVNPSLEAYTKTILEVFVSAHWTAPTLADIGNGCYVDYSCTWIGQAAFLFSEIAKYSDKHYKRDIVRESITQFIKDMAEYGVPIHNDYDRNETNVEKRKKNIKARAIGMEKLLNRGFMVFLSVCDNTTLELGNKVYPMETDA